MKLITLLLAGALLLVTQAFAYQDLPAKYCELFIDKVTVNPGKFDSRIVTIYLKTLNERLDGKIQEVGFRHMVHVSNQRGHYSSRSWSNMKAVPFMNARNYFEISLPVSHGFGNSLYTGSFYVLTDKGTTYWVNQRDEGNFNFNEGTYKWIEGSLRIKMEYFNPTGCY